MKTTPTINITVKTLWHLCKLLHPEVENLFLLWLFMCNWKLLVMYTVLQFRWKCTSLFCAITVFKISFEANQTFDLSCTQVIRTFQNVCAFGQVKLTAKNWGLRVYQIFKTVGPKCSIQSLFDRLALFPTLPKPLIRDGVPLVLWSGIWLSEIKRKKSCATLVTKDA